MLTTTTRSASALLAIALLTTSCANTMHGMGQDASKLGTEIENNPKAVLGSVGGAGAGALIAGLAGASPAWIVGSALMGGLLGGYVGHRLDDNDKMKATNAAAHALEKNRARQAAVWSNPDTGNHGEIRPTKTYQLADGRYCRRYEQSIWVDGKKETSSGTACRQADGSWKIES